MIKTFSKKRGEFVVICTDVRKHNFGVTVGNIGLAMVAIGISLAAIGQLVTHNAVEPRVIIGDNILKTWFLNVFEKVKNA